MVVIIKLDKKKSMRLAKHLEKEHPSTKGKICVNGKKLKRRSKK